jgi:membrane dipeptidase
MKSPNRTTVTSHIRGINLLSIISLVVIFLVPSCKNRPKEKSDEELREMALKICENNIVLDSHIDWPERIIDHPENISGRTAKGDFDLVRAKVGGLNAALSVVYVNSRFGVDEGRVMADSMLKLITSYTKSYPGKFALAGNPEDIRRNFKEKLFSFVLCLENGSPTGNDLNYLKYLKDKGIVYVTLCHNKANQISDSNFDTNHKWNGLSPFGMEVIKTMNQLGIMIDISHSTDSTVFQSLRYSKAPIIASHSSCRYFTPGLERNLPDTLIKAIASKNGVIMVNLCSAFLDSTCLKNWNYLEKWYDSTGIDELSKEGIDFTLKYGETHKLHSNSKQLVDHIDHIVNLVGADHVGIGSDFDGIGLSQPSDLPDVSTYPVIVFELLKRGYTEETIKKILSENLLRVWSRVIEIADSLNKNSPN